MTVSDVFQMGRQRIKPKWKTAFLSAFFLGLLIHLPILLSDIPNHDGLDSIYFDQNMITSGRWFLTVACGASSYYTVPWVIGLLGLFFLGLTSVCLTELFQVEKLWAVVVISGLLVSFPALASTFAYVFGGIGGSSDSEKKVGVFARRSVPGLQPWNLSGLYCLRHAALPGMLRDDLCRRWENCG